MPPAEIEPSVQPSSVAPEPSGPRYARSTGSIVLHADPTSNAHHVELRPDPEAPAQRVVELLEADPSGAWWRVRTLVPRQALALGLESGAGVAVLNLEGWVDAGALVEFEPDAAPQAQPSAAKPSVHAEAILFKVAAGTLLHWPDGRVAGEVVEDHCFHGPAMLRVGESGEQRLLCHEHRAAVGVGIIDGWLCTNESEIPEDGVVAPQVIALDEPREPAPEAAAPAAGELPRGSLDREIIRGIVRAHIDEVRDCYNVGLLKDPTLEGRVSINFVISENGTITSSIVGSDTLTDKAVGQCIAQAVATWVFPKPRGGGNVIVTYPFNLTPG